MGSLEEIEEGEIKENDNMEYLQNTSSNFDELEEGEIREEIDLVAQIEETCRERLNVLLSKQEVELKIFKALKNSIQMEYKENCRYNISVQKLEILDNKFEKHVKGQYRNFISMQIGARNKERELEKSSVEMAKNGKFEMSFIKTPIPDSRFEFKRFDYESELRILLDDNGSSVNALEKSNANPNLNAQNPNHIPSPNPYPNLESEAVVEEDKMACDNDTTTNIPNPNSPLIVIQIQNPNLENEIIVTELPEEIIRNPNPLSISEIQFGNNDNFANEETTLESFRQDMDNIVSNSTPDVPPHQVVQSANMIFNSIFCQTPTSNQNVPPGQESSPQFPTQETGIMNQLIQLRSEMVDKDPFQNELAMLHNLQDGIIQRHEQKKAQVKAECEMEMEQVANKYRQVAAELDSQLADSRHCLGMRYDTLYRHQRLAREFREIYHGAPLPVPVSRPATPYMMHRPPASSSSVVQSPVLPVQNQNSGSQFFVNRIVTMRPSVMHGPGAGSVLHAPGPHTNFSAGNVHMNIGDMRNL